VSSIRQSLQVSRVLFEAGVLQPMRPDKLLRIALGARRWGKSPAFGMAALAIRKPRATAIIDDLGSVTYEEVHRRSNALARALGNAGIRSGDSVGLMSRNHRGFVEAALACSKVGANTVLLNTMFAGPQLSDVAKRESIRALLYDEEFAELVEGVEDVPRLVTFGGGRDQSIDEAIAGCSDDDVEPPTMDSRFTVLTSGTTGTPKGARRGTPKGFLPVASMLSKLPLRAEGRTMLAAPMFHSWGLGHLQLGLMLGSTYVLTRRFDAEATLHAIAEHRCTALAVVPVMLQRILALPDSVKQKYDLSSLQVTAVSGAALPGDLATEWMDTFGDNLYNLYGSTEVAMATIATPEDMRAAPGTAGRPPLGAAVRILDHHDRPVPRGKTGRIFVANAISFEGYTTGGDKERIGNLVSSGDVGHFDEDGRLFIDGRDDEMIVSGGENVFPREVEDLLIGFQGVQEVAVVGVSDPEYGQRLKAFVVLEPGASVTEKSLKTHVRENLASYKVPREVAFLGELPRTATGKVLKRELVQPRP